MTARKPRQSKCELMVVQLMSKLKLCKVQQASHLDSQIINQNFELQQQCSQRDPNSRIQSTNDCNYQNSIQNEYDELEESRMAVKLIKNKRSCSYLMSSVVREKVNRSKRPQVSRDVFKRCLEYSHQKPNLRPKQSYINRLVWKKRQSLKGVYEDCPYDCCRFKDDICECYETPQVFDTRVECECHECRENYFDQIKPLPRRKLQEPRTRFVSTVSINNERSKSNARHHNQSFVNKTFKTNISEMRSTSTKLLNVKVIKEVKSKEAGKQKSLAELKESLMQEIKRGVRLNPVSSRKVSQEQVSHDNNCKQRNDRDDQDDDQDDEEDFGYAGSGSNFDGRTSCATPQYESIASNALFKVLRNRNRVMSRTDDSDSSNSSVTVSSSSNCYELGSPNRCKIQL